MKKMKLMLVALMMMGTANTVMAQDAFNAIRESAENIVDNPKATNFELKVNQYKLTALQYIPTQGIKQNGAITTGRMDSLAFGMHLFLTNYFGEIGKAKEEKARKEAIDKYIKVSKKYPLYDDKNVESTESFVNDPGGFTPFSINVNWLKACAELGIKLD